MTNTGIRRPSFLPNLLCASVPLWFNLPASPLFNTPVTGEPGPDYWTHASFTKAAPEWFSRRRSLGVSQPRTASRPLPRRPPIGFPKAALSVAPDRRYSSPSKPVSVTMTRSGNFVKGVSPAPARAARRDSRAGHRLYLYALSRAKDTAFVPDAKSL